MQPLYDHPWWNISLDRLYLHCQWHNDMMSRFTASLIWLENANSLPPFGLYLWHDTGGAIQGWPQWTCHFLGFLPRFPFSWKLIKRVWDCGDTDRQMHTKTVSLSVSCYAIAVRRIIMVIMANNNPLLTGLLLNLLVISRSDAYFVAESSWQYNADQVDRTAADQGWNMWLCRRICTRWYEFML